MSDKLLEQILFELRRNRVGALWGTNDIALFLNVSRSTIFRLIHRAPTFQNPSACQVQVANTAWAADAGKDKTS